MSCWQKRQERWRGVDGVRTRGSAIPGNKAGQTFRMETVVCNIKHKREKSIRKLPDVVISRSLVTLRRASSVGVIGRCQMAVEVTRVVPLGKFVSEMGLEWEL